MAFLNQTKTVAIMCIVIVVMLGILIWVNKDSIFGGKDSEKKGSEKENEEEANERTKNILN
ncbi:MAG: hypothetical protein MJ204_02725 [Bacteroidales bacterium]|nr:hypothetical protein [Bacteroidales bacterium]MCQ2605442.1 hypothetical protein [Bacteroidales bacterium]